MPGRSYKGAKRQREIAKKKKKEQKARKKAERGDGSDDSKAYLEYLYPGGIPHEVLAEHGLLDDDEDDDDDDEDDEDED